MNKKHIATAALLAAGSVFANAVVYDTTFSNTSDNTNVSSLTVNVTNGASASLTSLKFSTGVSVTDSSSYTSDGSLLAKGNINGYGILAPDANVSNAKQWQATLSYSGFSTSWDFTGIQLDTLGFNSAGNWQNNSNAVAYDGSNPTNPSNNAAGKYVNFKVEYSLNSGSDWTELGTYAIDVVSPGEGVDAYTGTDTGRKTLFSVSGDAVTIAQDATLLVRISTSQTNYTAGTFAGLRTVSLIPEPSAFGLIAGLGALALVASRRRRK